jgi:hypothetical protein
MPTQSTGIQVVRQLEQKKGGRFEVNLLIQEETAGEYCNKRG